MFRSYEESTTKNYPVHLKYRVTNYSIIRFKVICNNLGLIWNWRTNDRHIQFLQHLQMVSLQLADCIRTMTDMHSSFSTSKMMSLSTHRSYMTWNGLGIDLEFAWNRAKKSHFFFLPGFHPEWPGITRGWLRIWHLIFFFYLDWGWNLHGVPPNFYHFAWICLDS